MIKKTTLGRFVKTGCVAAAFGLIPLASAYAEDSVIPGKFTGYATLASEYIFRGVSLSNDQPAMQGSIDYGLGGFHAGVWGTSGQFGTGNVELDYTAGYGGDIGAFTYDATVIYYTYPGDGADGNYFVVVGTLGRDFGIAATHVGAGYTPKGQAAFGDDDAMYLFADLSIPIPNTPISAGFHVGYEDFGIGGTRTHWTAGLTADFAGLTWAAQYVDTNRPGGNLDSRALFSVTKSF
jgi:uncharacterized protein (TIGR02001 family)